MADELVEYDAIVLGRLVRKCEISAIELLDITIQRIEKINHKLNAIIHKIYDQAREIAEGLNQDNLSIGVQFAGRFGDEATLFRLAAQLERARPWADKKPPIHCNNDL